jgi:hypothetical protein
MPPKYIYIPVSSSDTEQTKQEHADITGLIKSLDTNRDNLQAAYDKKLVSIQNEFYKYRNEDKLMDQYLEKEIATQKEKDSLYYQNIVMKNNDGLQNIATLIKDVKGLQRDLMDNNRNYTSIQSLNGQHLTVSNVNNTTDYMIHVNNKCVDVDNNNYTLQMCNSDNPSQRFSINRVNDNSSYLSQYDIRAPANEIMSYPYNLVKSKLTGLCLEEKNGNIMLSNCQSLNGQKWRGMHSDIKKC